MEPKKSIAKYWVIIGLVLISGCSFSQSNTEDSLTKTVAILKIEKELLDAVTFGDTVVWKKYLDDSFLMVSEDGSRNNKQQFISSLRPLPKGYSGQINITEPKIVFRDNVAVVNFVADEEEFVYGQKLHTTYATMNVYYKGGTEWKLFSSQVFEIPQKPPAVKVSAGILKNYVGVYELAENITYTVSIENNILYGLRSGREKQELLPETENVFFVKDDSRGRKLFVKDVQGKMQMITRRNGNDIIWKKIK